MTGAQQCGDINNGLCPAYFLGPWFLLNCFNSSLIVTVYELMLVVMKKDNIDIIQIAVSDNEGLECF